MNQRQQARAAHVKGLIDGNPMPRNQIATISGLTNTYIRDLESGNIVNVERGKLIALALALNLTLVQLDEMLLLFDRAPLSSDDIPLFLRTAEKKKTTSVMLPVRNRFSFDLYIIAALRTPGTHNLASHKPMVALYHRDYWVREQRERIDVHPLYRELTEAIGSEMSKQLHHHLEQWPVQQYISQYSMENYLSKTIDPELRAWHVKHVQQLIECLDRYSTMQLHLTRESSNFLFTLKTPPKESKTPEQLLISNLAPPGPKLRSAGLLSGLATSNQVMVDNFREELTILKSMLVEEYQEKNRLISYLEELIG